jgi:hypothetical protein
MTNKANGFRCSKGHGSGSGHKNVGAVSFDLDKSYNLFLVVSGFVVCRVGM